MSQTTYKLLMNYKQLYFIENFVSNKIINLKYQLSKPQLVSVVRA